MNTANLAKQLRQRGARLAALAVQRMAARLAQQWQDVGEVTADQGRVQLRGRGLARRRRGSRTALPDADLLWPDSNDGGR
ncbi:hypothetical protein [Sandarakinorhabdus sp.]|uniref:hypothetical protein n=1 Tax=Sandarakinorhabdus sp. TaxID=1916663 RepID=UPI00333FE77E